VAADHRPQARPGPGYAAPPDTIEPATRATEVLAAVLRDAVATGALTDPPAGDLPAEVAGDLEAISSGLFEGVPTRVVARAVVAWTGVFGLVSFELFGQHQNIIDHRQAFFDHAVADLGRTVGLDG
jgi:hypothetical protein